MWTPKRLLLLVFGFVFFFAAYEVYVFFLGKYDGLPPLPADLAAADENEVIEPVQQPRLSSAEVALIKAFGSSCPELSRPIKLHWRLQGVVLAAKKHQLLENGQLRLFNVSLATFGKPKPDGKGIDINTVRGEKADIEFDKPLTDIRDATNPNRKAVAGVIEGDVVLKNNRRTEDPNDDLELHTNKLYYRDDQHRIWTDEPVRIIDGNPLQPRNTVDGKGMEVVLIPSEDTGHNTAAKKKQNGISGVKRAELKEAVHMILQVDAKSNFLGGPSQKSENEPMGPAPAGTAANAPQDAQLTIDCRGKFVYEPGTENDQAEFHDGVNVIRKLRALPDSQPLPVEQSRYDQLDCDKLVLLFEHKKLDEKRSANAEPGEDLELTRAHAMGKQVELTSDSQHLHVTCNDLHYDKKTNQTILLGDPELVAEKEKATIRMRGTLTLQHPPQDSKDKDIQEAHAQGPGNITMQRGENKPNHTARWRESLHSIKEGKGDRYTLFGDASFEDPEHGKLQADQIIVWVEPIESQAAGKTQSPVNAVSTPATAAGSAKSEARGDSAEYSRRPRRMEANGHVVLDSKDLLIPSADRLHITFEDVPPGSLEPATPPPGAAPKAPPASAPPTLTGPPDGQKDKVLPAPDMGNKKPIQLTARLIDAKVATDGSRNDLRKVNAEGHVHVVQQPATPEEKGTEIKGDSLELDTTPNGHVLKVVAPQAYVQLDKITIIGPEVHIDQPKNEVVVHGLGSMKLPTKTDFQGNALAQPTDVIVYWNKDMYFNGKFAEYHGGVLAVQGTEARLRATMLQVVLDRFVSLKERQPGQGDSQAALYRMLCDKEVEMENGVREGTGTRLRWHEFQRIAGQEVDFNNPDSELKVSGPGTVWLLRLSSRQDNPLNVGQRGSAASSSPSLVKATQPATKPGENPPEAVMKLTRIQFEDRMHGFKLKGLAIFTGKVKMLYLPADDPDVTINPDKLPQDSMYVECDRLEVLNKKLDDQRQLQELVAFGRIRLTGRNEKGQFKGEGDKLKYDENKGMLVLEGESGNVARLVKQSRPNGPYEPVTAKQIMFWPKENHVKFEGTRDIGSFK